MKLRSSSSRRRDKFSYHRRVAWRDDLINSIEPHGDTDPPFRSIPRRDGTSLFSGFCCHPSEFHSALTSILNLNSHSRIVLFFRPSSFTAYSSSDPPSGRCYSPSQFNSNLNSNFNSDSPLPSGIHLGTSSRTTIRTIIGAVIASFRSHSLRFILISIHLRLNDPIPASRPLRSLTSPLSHLF